MTTTTSTTPIRVYLVDDQVLIRAALRNYLSQNPQMLVLGDNGDPREAIARIGELRPDVVLLDITMPGLSGIDAIPKIRELHPRTRILMVSHHEGESFVQQALKAGADGYLSKNSDLSELTMGIQAVHAGHGFISPRLTSGILAGIREPAVAAEARAAGGRVDSLTAREREVFQLLALGKSNKQVARDLDISVGTARKHRENVKRKLQCDSAAEMARLAIQEGLLGSD